LLSSAAAPERLDLSHAPPRRALSLDRRARGGATRASELRKGEAPSRRHRSIRPPSVPPSLPPSSSLLLRREGAGPRPLLQLSSFPASTRSPFPGGCSFSNKPDSDNCTMPARSCGPPLSARRQRRNGCARLRILTPLCSHHPPHTHTHVRSAPEFPLSLRL